MRLNFSIRRVLAKFRMYCNLGVSALVDDLLNQKRHWKLKDSYPEGVVADGSISGRDSGYLRIVKLASVEEKAFSRFKSNREYREILEHVNREQGREYLSCINQYGLYIKSLRTFIRMDYCKPFRYTYPKIGRVSPTNLRYAKIALDIRVLFGSISEFRIAEIGVGYGGQFHAISTIGNPYSYTLYDLPDVNQLALNYILNFTSTPTKVLIGDFNDSSFDFDLVISNYAFSELNRDLQETYLKNVIARSKRGYLIYNDIVEGGLDTIRIEEFASRIPGALIVNEFPLTKLRNNLIIWGHGDISRLVLN